MHVDVRVEGSLGRLVLDREDKLNALSPVLLGQLAESCAELARARDVRVVILEGAGSSFSSGADLPAFVRGLGESPEETAAVGNRAVAALLALPQLTIASIDGHCVGGGVVLAASCDIRIAAQSARFWIPEILAGLPLAWGGLPRLVELVGETAAIELVVMARPFGAEEARSLGFLTRVVTDLGSETAEVASTLLGRARYPLMQTKRQLQAIRAGEYDLDGDVRALIAAGADEESGSVLESYAARLERSRHQEA